MQGGENPLEIFGRGCVLWRLHPQATQSVLSTLPLTTTSSHSPYALATLRSTICRTRKNYNTANRKTLSECACPFSTLLSLSSSSHPCPKLQNLQAKMPSSSRKSKLSHCVTTLRPPIAASQPFPSSRAKAQDAHTTK